MISHIGIWKISLDSKVYSGAVLMYLSKSVDTKPRSYNSRPPCLWLWQIFIEIFFSYLTNKFQRTKVNSSFISWSELIRGVLLSYPFNPLSANPTKGSNTLKQSVFDHFVKLALKGLTYTWNILVTCLKQQISGTAQMTLLSTNAMQI